MLLRFIHLLPVLVMLFGACTKVNKSDDTKGKVLSIERIYSAPSLRGSMPKGVQVSPNGEKITFLKEKPTDIDTLDLWEFDVKTGEQKLLVDSQTLLDGKEEIVSDEERARRERMRVRSKGIISYQWSKQGDKILFPMNGDLYIYNLDVENPVMRITNTESFEMNPYFSPQGNYVSFIRNFNVFIFDLRNKSEKQITFSGTQENPMGVAEFIAQEEMSRYNGYWWSPNEKYLAIAKVNNEPVANIKRFEIYADKVNVVEQKYPKAGENNAIVTLGLFKVAKKSAPQWVRVEEKDYYIPNVKWRPSEFGDQLSYTVQSRDQKTLSFWSFNADSGKSNKIFVEKDKAWVNIRHDYIFLKKSNEMLWVSEKSGYAHIHLYNLDTGDDRQVTSGVWVVDNLLSVDEVNKNVFYTGSKESPLESHLYRVSLIKEVNPEKLSKGSGRHMITMPKEPKFYLDYYSSEKKPLSLSVHSLDGERRFYIEENKLTKSHPLFEYKDRFSDWEYSFVEKENGTPLYYKFLKPKNFSKNRKYPVVQYVYGGPGVQLVNKSWGGNDLFQQVLVQNGFVVIVGDNRGTPRRGRGFERAYYRNFGSVEVEDQVEILKHALSTHSYMDKDRVGVYGHSYGGYLTAMLMVKKPDLYHVGVSGAPVIDWSYYDTHYTERYLGHPGLEKEVYKKANVTTHTDGLKGRLLVAHGMADDNVLYSHSLILYQDLQSKGKMFDIMAYPGAKHGIRREKSWSVHYKKSILNYFKDHLLKEIK